MPGVGMYKSMASVAHTDITNPRQIYSILSESRHQGYAKVKSQAGAKLPPLNGSSGVQLRFLEKRPHHRSYPDLVSFRRDKADPRNLEPVRRSSSLQDVTLADSTHTDTKPKKLKPILRGNDSKSKDEKAGVKFGQKEVHMIQNFHLPPIEATVDSSNGKTAQSFSVDAQEKQGENAVLSPRHHRNNTTERPSNIFPRGKAVEVKKPVTPTYDDYPEAYWELRSATVQDPSDLKEGMIDRDRYRLQQISTLRLRAMNREAAINRLDSYRKWQLQMLETTYPVNALGKHDAQRRSVTPGRNGSTTPAKTGKQHRMSAPIANDDLAVAATSISPQTKKQTYNNKTFGADSVTNYLLTDEELRRRQKIDATARRESGCETEARPIKAAVVNLCMDPEGSTVTTSDVYTGIRRVMLGVRPLSSRFKTFVTVHSQDQASEHDPKPPGSVSVASVNATLGSSQGHRLTRIPSVPTDSAADESQAPATDNSDADTTASSKKTMKKFKKLQVFSEKTSSRERPTDATRPADRPQYLPQTRPPTYKLDMRHYPVRYTSSGRGQRTEMGVIDETGDGFSLLPREQDGGVISTSHRGDPEVSMRFSNGEVIISRQGSRPSVT